MQSREFTVLTPKQQQLWDFLCLLGVTTSNLSPESSWHKYASAFSELAKFEVAELSSELKLYRRYTLLRYAVELYERQKGVGKNEQEVLQTIRAGLKLGEGQLYQELDNYSRQLQKSGFQFQFLVDQQRMRYLHRANQAKAALAASQSAVKDAQRWSTVFQNQEGTERHLWNTVCGLDLASQKKRLESAGRILKVHVGTEALLRETEVYLEQHISPHRPTHFADLDLLFWYSVKVGKTKKQQQLEGLLKPGLEREKFKVRLMRHATK